MKLTATCNIPFVNPIVSNALPVTSGLVIDLNANDGVNASSGNVVSWNNTGALGGSILVRSGTPSVPFIAVDANFNNKSSVAVTGGMFGEFDATGTDFTQGATIIQVAKRNGVAGRMFWQFTDNAGSSPLDLWDSNSNNVLGLNTFNGNTQGFSAGNQLDTACVITSLLKNADYYSFGMYFNGVNKSPLVNTNGGANHPIGSKFWLGRVSDDGDNYAFNGWFARSLVYNRILSEPELASVHTYLKNEYGIA